MVITFGENIRLEIYGESHGNSIGVKISGIPAGMTIDTRKLQDFLNRRVPGRNAWSTSRQENDRPLFVSGAKPADEENEDGLLETDGQTIEAVIYNRDIRKGDYKGISTVPRPSHADYPAWVKYGRIPSGGGQFSARLTAPLCIAGGIFRQWLESAGVEVIAHIGSIGDVYDEPLDTLSPENDDVKKSIKEEKQFPVISSAQKEKMKALIAKAKDSGDSIGGTIECKITGLPAGIGEPLFGNIESRICQTVFAVPAVKGIEFGNGFASARLQGSENNDPFCIEEGQIRTKTNNHGGILGGLSSGMPLLFRVAMKPTPSIAMAQDSVDLETMNETKLEIKGRHDPCIVPRAVPCIEAAAAVAIGDILLGEGLLTSAAERKSSGEKKEGGRGLRDFRAEIDRIDKELVTLLEERFDAARDVIRYKALRGMPVLDSGREKEVLDGISSLCREDTLPYMKNNFEKIIEESRRFQEEHRAQYGLLGRGLGHSHSPAVHRMLGGYEYGLFDVAEDQLDDFMRNGGFKGISVTMPYKKAVIPYCSEISKRARDCGSVNTIVRDEKGNLYGDNTDYFGFKYMIENSGISVASAKALVLGSGGVSGTAICVLKDLGAAEIVNISRTGEDNYENIDLHSDAQIIVNATPVGMFPEAGKAPVDLGMFPSCSGVLDIVYNPLKTKLMLDAELRGIPYAGGIDMLVAQAAEACWLFTGNEVPHEKIREVIERLTSDLENIVLIGMPGSGKTTVGRELAARLGREFIDLDERIEKIEGKTPEEIINTSGEDTFRQIETETLKKIVRGKGRSGMKGIVLATGGGIVERDINRELLRENGRVIYLRRPLEDLPADGRPISQALRAEELYERRHLKYEQWSDEKADNNNIEDTVNIVEHLVVI